VFRFTKNPLLDLKIASMSFVDKKEDRITLLESGIANYWLCAGDGNTL